ncbi:leucoanthocyanidin dioxygenase-like [Papaver somniferum]|uniref:leucoanthocyanidin dioxygenase-like n=1 Tax=Papaver somniferum TaxID=3469 RepID=UPI000E6F7ACE|nr:leucoanthocyanidin dioxygenase-like [Papaver somniferum]
MDFQRIGHAIPQSSLDDMYNVSKQFFDLPLEEKQRYASSKDDAFSDLHGIGCDSIIANIDDDQFFDWYNARSLSEVILKAMSKSLGLEENDLVHQLGDRQIVHTQINFYRACSRPDLVYSIRPVVAGYPSTTPLMKSNINSISSDYQRKLLNLGKENAKLKVENSTNVELLCKARERNEEIIDKEKNYLARIEELKTQLAAKEKIRLEEAEKLSMELYARNSKYQQLKKNYVLTVSNNGKDAIRARDAAVKRVCVDNGIPLSKYKFADVPPSEVVPHIIDSEPEYEDDEEYEEESNSEAEHNDN